MRGVDEKDGVLDYDFERGGGGRSGAKSNCCINAIYLPTKVGFLAHFFLLLLLLSIRIVDENQFLFSFLQRVCIPIPFQHRKKHIPQSKTYMYLQIVENHDLSISLQALLFHHFWKSSYVCVNNNS